MTLAPTDRPHLLRGVRVVADRVRGGEVLLAPEKAMALDATGANGSTLLVNSNLVEHSGTGAEPSGCEWPALLAMAAPGVLFVDPMPISCP